MPIRCIALDLDRTTLDGEGRLSPQNRAAIGEMIRSGREVIVASGRPFASLPGEVTALPGIRFAITSNGAAVYELPEGKCLVRHRLRPESVDGILAAAGPEAGAGEVAVEALEDGVPYCAAAYYGDPTAFGVSGWGVGYIRRTRRPVEDILAFIRSRRDRLDTVNLSFRDDRLRRRMWARLEDRVPGIYLTASRERFIEISDSHGGKHRALAALLRRLGIPPAETAAFGDGDNDAPMLALVGAGVAVANATPLCRQAAAYFTDSHDRDGVAKWLRQVLPTL